jgi:hypothetical protein
MFYYLVFLFLELLSLTATAEGCFKELSLFILVWVSGGRGRGETVIIRSGGGVLGEMDGGGDWDAVNGVQDDYFISTPVSVFLIWSVRSVTRFNIREFAGRRTLGPATARHVSVVL